MFIITIVFIVVAILMVRFLLKRDRGAKEPPQALWSPFVFGILAIAIAFPLELYLIPDEAMKFFSYTMLGSFIEEGVKFIPLAFFIYKKNYFNEHTDGIIYFALCGLTFGLLENILYTLSMGAGVGLLRLIVLPLFHTANSAIIGYYLARVKINKESILKTILAFIFIVVLHAMYNFGLSSESTYLVIISLMLTALVTTGIFIYFMMARQSDEKEGLSSIGNNEFCRNCGSHNLNKTMFCQYCGKRT